MNEQEMIIQVVGVGCGACRRLESDLCVIIAQTGLNARVEKIDDPLEIALMGIFHLPQLIIDGHVVPFLYRNRASVERVLAEHVAMKSE
ncbi:MAG: thioredoxin family protein [Chloroflexota bacterium]|jgi:hypothetical protein